jgi:hypothetical protein
MRKTFTLLFHADPGYSRLQPEYATCLPLSPSGISPPKLRSPLLHFVFETVSRELVIVYVHEGPGDELEAGSALICQGWIAHLISPKWTAELYASGLSACGIAVSIAWFLGSRLGSKSD